MALAVILLAVAFYTLLERRILGYSHERLGPNKVGYLGFIQPFRDAIKLFSKESVVKFKGINYYFYFISPIWGIFISIIIWILIGIWGGFSFLTIGFIIFFCLSSFSVYFLLIGGWSSYRKYSLIGSYRSSSQAISYEVVLVISLLMICFLLNTYDPYIYIWSFSSVAFYFTLPLFLVWVISCYAETNRSPFDFREGESELVSGFNTEYGGGSFSLIFIGEYRAILFLSILRGLIFFSMGFMLVFCILLVSFSYLWVRCSFPRLRYDKLIIICWKGLLIYVLGRFFLGIVFLI